MLTVSHRKKLWRLHSSHSNAMLYILTYCQHKRQAVNLEWQLVNYTWRANLNTKRIHENQSGTLWLQSVIPVTSLPCLHVSRIRPRWRCRESATGSWTTLFCTWTSPRCWDRSRRCCCNWPTISEDVAAAAGPRYDPPATHVSRAAPSRNRTNATAINHHRYSRTDPQAHEPTDNAADDDDFGLTSPSSSRRTESIIRSLPGWHCQVPAVVTRWWRRGHWRAKTVINITLRKTRICTLPRGRFPRLGNFPRLQVLKHWKLVNVINLELGLGNRASNYF